MKIVATSDLHGRLPAIPDCDLLIIAGDICPDDPIGKAARYGLPDKGASYQSDWLGQTLWPWLDEIRSRGIETVAIWGNHDFVGEHPHLIPMMLPWTLLQDEAFEFHGLKLWGTPWVPGLPRWAFYGSSEALAVRSEGIPNDIDVLITHGPPFGIADFVAPQFGSVHVGDPALSAAIERIQPELIICGHIHEQHGRHGNLYNVAHMDENYNVFNKRPPTVIEL